MIYKKKYQINSSGVLYIPRGIYLIPPGEFKRDDKITKVIVEKDVKFIGKEAFFRCKKLKEVFFVPESECYSIGERSFNACLELKKVTFPFCLQQIGPMAFQYDLEINEVCLPSRTVHIGERAFENCISIKRVECQNKYVNFDYEAFWGCAGIRSFKIGEKDVPIKFLHYNIVFLGSRFNFQNGEACIFTMGEYCRDGKIIGEKFFYFFLDDGEFIGIGENLRKAYNEAIFLKNNNIKERAVKEKWTMSTQISMDEYRVLSGDCLIGVEAFLKHYNIPFDKKMPIKDVIQLVQGAGAFDKFMEFVDNVIVPNTKEEEKKINKSL